LAAFLDKEPEAKKSKAISIARSLGYNIRMADINTSGKVWEIDGKTLVQPLSSLKGLGDAAIDQIMARRPFNSVEELLFNENIVYSKLNKKALDVMIRGQAMNKLMDDRFTGLKHFWSAVAVDRPKTEKKLIENIELYRPEGEFSTEEKIEYISRLTGIYPLELVIDDEKIKKFQKLKIPPLGEFDTTLKIAWFIPREVISKKTKHGKVYWIIKVVDNNTATDIKCWGVRPNTDYIKINTPYIAKLDYSETWGFSTRSIKHNFKVLNN
jgi:DNA polymerase III alpha subunit